MPLPLAGEAGRSDLHLQVALAHHAFPWRRVQEVLAGPDEEAPSALRSRPLTSGADVSGESLLPGPISRSLQGLAHRSDWWYIGCQISRAVRLRYRPRAPAPHHRVAGLGAMPRARRHGRATCRAVASSGFAALIRLIKHPTRGFKRQDPLAFSRLEGQAGPAMAGASSGLGSRESAGAAAATTTWPGLIVDPLQRQVTLPMPPGGRFHGRQPALPQSRAPGPSRLVRLHPGRTQWASSASRRDRRIEALAVGRRIRRHPCLRPAPLSWPWVGHCWLLAGGRLCHAA